MVVIQIVSILSLYATPTANRYHHNQNTHSNRHTPRNVQHTPRAHTHHQQPFHSKDEAASLQQQRLRKSTNGKSAHTRPEHAAADRDSHKPPSVYLVGVGPGDVQLLTLKALNLMERADLVLYDRLISPEVLALVSASAKMLYVGKEAGLHTRSQEEIHELLLHYATSGRTVLRLKGGDPTVFGRGGEELEYLEKRGVPVQIVPGITAASGISACLRVPLTHRDHADSVRFVTGHARSENSAPVRERYDWEQLASDKTTLVIYMGLTTLPELAEGLVGAGLPASTPAVAVQDGTTVTQRVVQAGLVDLPAAVERAELRSPTLIIIGSVVGMMVAGETVRLDDALTFDSDMVLALAERARRTMSADSAEPRVSRAQPMLHEDGADITQ